MTDHRSLPGSGVNAPDFTLRCEKNGTSERALVVIDPDGKIHWSYLSPIGINPGANGILSALEI